MIFFMDAKTKTKPKVKAVDTVAEVDMHLPVWLDGNRWTAGSLLPDEEAAKEVCRSVNKDPGKAKAQVVTITLPAP
jgi:hypothetical protein